MSIVILLVIVAAVSIILGIVFHKKDDGPGPDPNPPGPPFIPVNPYYLVDDGSYVKTNSYIKGHLSANQTKLDILRSSRSNVSN
jgi:hypothetical protein